MWSFHRLPLDTHSVLKQLGVGELSSFVQKKVDVLAFDLQRQHGRNFTSVGRIDMVQGNSKMGPNRPKQADW